MHAEAGDRISSALPFRLILPGLVLILLVDALAVSGLWPSSPFINQILPLIMLVLPWVTLVVSRERVWSLGYRQDQVFRAFGWGMVAGGFWRVISILINFWSVELGAALSAAPVFIGAILWVPLVEETFYRGYLGRTLIQKLGLWPGIILQALLFSLFPVHLTQGSMALLSIFGFGMLAGWIQHHFDNIWSAWGAHAFANVLPLLVIYRSI